MSRGTAAIQRGPARRRGHSLVELSMAVALILTVLCSIFEVFSNGREGAIAAETGMQALLLARGLLEEISAKGFEEPGASGSFGRESGEKKNDRRAYDDVDDYDHYGPWSPPLDADGSALADFRGFTQSVFVENVQAGDFGAAQGNGSTPFKRVRVVIRAPAPGEAEVILEKVFARK